MRAVSEINADIESVLEPASRRMADAGEEMRCLRPAELDWATVEELARLDALQLELVRPGHVHRSRKGKGGCEASGKTEWRCMN
jgi:hypothetical protein